MPRRTPKDTNPPVHVKELSTPQIIERGWQDFKDFAQTDTLDKLPENRKPGKEFRDNLRRLLEEYPDETKAIFGAGFLGSLHLLVMVTAETAEEMELEHTATHHQRDPRIPRA